jgi:hypothetical protein
VPDVRVPAQGSSRVRLSSPAILIPIVAALIAVVAGAVAIAQTRDEPPVYGRADTFLRPFDYQVPAHSGIRLYLGSLETAATDPSDHLHVLTAPGAPEGISIWVVEEMIADPCAPQGPLASREPGREGMLSFLHSVHGLRVEQETQIRLDGRLATQIDVAAENGRSGCPEKLMYLWRDTSARIDQQPVMTVPDGERVRVNIVDVDGATIAIEIWSRDNLDRWLVAANPIVESIRFFHVSSPSSSSASPTSSP